MRCYHCTVNSYFEKCCLSMSLPIPFGFMKKMDMRAEMTEKGILAPILKIILTTHYPLVKQQPPISPPSDIPHSRYRCRILSLNRWEMATQYLFFEAQADDTTEKKGKMEPERNDQDKQGEIPLLQVFGNYMTKKKMKPEWRAPQSQRAGTRVKAPGQLRLSGREMQRTTVDDFTHADGSSELGATISLQVVIGMRPDITDKSPLVGTLSYYRWDGEKRWWS